MKTLILLFTIFTVQYAYCEDWTVNYHTFADVVVVKQDDARVYIDYTGGTGSLYLSECPVELQTRFHYDPVKAKALLGAEAVARAKAQPKPLYLAPVVPPAPTTAAQSSKLTTDQKLAIEEQIIVLQSDVSEKSRLEEKNFAAHTSGAGYRDIIAQEKAQIKLLQFQLNAGK